jgi:FAD/FMN-containing dehydrogenase
MATIDDMAVQKLATEFGGDLLRDGDDGFDDARDVYNGMFANRRPALVARCRSTADVVAAVNFARTSGVEVAVKGGGHSIAGFSSIDGGLLIDLSAMKHIDVDADARIARAQPGVLLGELDAATQEHGLATTLGFVSVTGIAGLTLNGGIGYLARKHGLSCDNLIGAEVVLADGTVVTASDDDHADLMWGLRGGGGNFGIVTRFEYRLHEVTEIFGHMRFYEPAAMKGVLRVFGDVMPGMPDEVVAFVGTLTIPENPMFPEEMHGKFVALVLVAYVGTQDEGEKVLAAFQPPGTPALEMAMSMPYVVAQQFQDEDLPRGRQNYWKAGNLTELSDEAIDVITERCVTATSPHCSTGLLLLGGAMGRVGENDTAYCGRDAVFNFSLDNIWEDPAENEAQIAWSREFHQAMTPFFSGGVYLNFTAEETVDRVRQAYGSNYERLASLKRTFDPTNLFRRNQNILPA